MKLNSIRVNNSDASYTHSIFDISEYNSGATYPDLTTALAAVPENKRQGGMTVRYVQTSDNKYIQYRLRSTSFNTTISNWDEEETSIFRYADIFDLNNKNISLGLRNFLLDIFVNNTTYQNRRITIASILNNYSNYYIVYLNIYKEDGETIDIANVACAGIIKSGIEKITNATTKISLLVDWSYMTGFYNTETEISSKYVKPHNGVLQKADLSSIAAIANLPAFNGGVLPYVNIQKDLDIKLSTFIIDASLNENISNVIVTYVVKNAGQRVIGFTFDLNGNTLPYSLTSKTTDEDVELIEDDYITVLVNWSAVPSGNTTFNSGIFDYKTYKKESLIDLYKVAGYDYPYFYAKGGKLLARCNNKYNAALAKYYKVDLGATIKKITCRFIACSTNASLMLITTALNTGHEISNITTKSNHSGITKDRFLLDTLTNMQSNPNAHAFIFDTPLTNGQEYTIKYEFLGDNQVKVTLPDNTIQTVTIDGIDEANGRYFIMEYYMNSVPGSYIRSKVDWAPNVTGICVESIDGHFYKEDFKRNGFLGVSPSGHVYTHFRNQTTTDTAYDVTN